MGDQMVEIGRRASVGRKGLAERGYTDGKNLKIDFKSAQGNFGTAQQIARLEAGEHEPSLATLSRLARVLGLEFHIDITPDSFELRDTA